jgi:hypothetical protein
MLSVSPNSAPHPQKHAFQRDPLSGKPEECSRCLLPAAHDVHNWLEQLYVRRPHSPSSTCPCLLCHTANAHSKDSDCTVSGDTDSCEVCGVYHGDECPDCGGRGFHKDACPTLDHLTDVEYAAAFPVEMASSDRRMR